MFDIGILWPYEKISLDWNLDGDCIDLSNTDTIAITVDYKIHSRSDIILQESNIYKYYNDEQE